VEDGLAGGFTWIDWAVVAGVIAFTTLLGERLSGKQQTVRDFFLGGRRLPWYAISASIVATEISAVTYVSLPSVVWKEGGNITYLQLGLIGSLLARLIVGYVLVPAYYEREIYSPYDYMGRRLGEGVRRTSTLLFSLGGLLGQAARVYLIAVVLEVLLFRELGWLETHLAVPPLAGAVCAIGVVAVAWTLIGGISTVIWTDAVLFLLFLLGIGVALFTVAGGVEGGFSAAMSQGWEAGKFRFFDFDTDPTKAYTFWAALFAATWGGVGSYGTDHLIAQRMFCCRNEREARKAIVASIAAMGVTFLVALVGIGLFAWYREHPLGGAAAAMVAEKPDRVFPVFIVEAIPTGLKGLVIAGAFAAAISSLDSILAALSQTTLSTLYLPGRRRVLENGGADPDSPEEQRRTLRISRGLVVFWGVMLCATAISMEVVAAHYASILDLALAMASYTGGALIAGFFLSLLPLGVDGSGYRWSAPLSVLAVFAIVWHATWAQVLVHAVLAVALLLWGARRLLPALGSGRDVRGECLRTVWLVVLAAVISVTVLRGHALRVDPDGATTTAVLAWPWYIPAGSTVAFVWGLLLGRRAPR
jgi:Na+/proline symporter